MNIPIGLISQTARQVLLGLRRRRSSSNPKHPRLLLANPLHRQVGLGVVHQLLESPRALVNPLRLGNRRYLDRPLGLDNRVHWARGHQASDNRRVWAHLHLASQHLDKAALANHRLDNRHLANQLLASPPSASPPSGSPLPRGQVLEMPAECHLSARYRTRTNSRVAALANHPDQHLTPLLHKWLNNNSSSNRQPQQDLVSHLQHPRVQQGLVNPRRGHHHLARHENHLLHLDNHRQHQIPLGRKPNSLQDLANHPQHLRAQQGLARQLQH